MGKTVLLVTGIVVAVGLAIFAASFNSAWSHYDPTPTIEIF